MTNAFSDGYGFDPFMLMVFMVGIALMMPISLAVGFGLALLFDTISDILAWWRERAMMRHLTRILAESRRNKKPPA